MTKRIITGLTGAVLLLFLVIKGGLFFAVAVAIIMTAGIWEYSRLTGAYGREADFLLLLSLSLLYFFGRLLSLYTD